MKHRGGRPRLDPQDQSAQVCVTLPAKQFDDYCLRALRHDVSVAEVIRRDLRDRRDHAQEKRVARVK